MPRTMRREHLAVIRDFVIVALGLVVSFSLIYMDSQGKPLPQVRTWIDRWWDEGMHMFLFHLLAGLTMVGTLLIWFHRTEFQFKWVSSLGLWLAVAETDLFFIIFGWTYLVFGTVGYVIFLSALAA